jgi:predicted protein tyrosine phosphatase
VQIQVAGYLAASWLLEQEPDQWHTLVVLDSGTQAADFVKAHARSYCCLCFDDVEAPRSNRQAPSKALVEQALHFAKGKEKLLVTCRAGQGRSVALGYVISSQEHGPAEALRLLNAKRHRPNRLVVSIADSLVESPDMLQRFEEWRTQNAHIQLSDYYDEIEKECEALEAQGACNKISPRAG